MSDTKAKEAKKLANKKYYESVKQLRQLKLKKQDSDIKQDTNFFLPKPQTPVAPVQKEQQQQPIYIQQQQQQPKQTLTSKALETLIISTIPMIPLLIKQCLILYANKQPKPEIQSDQPSMHYSQQMNTLEF